MSQPQDHPQPGHDWNDLNTREVEETLQAATDLAYHLADDIGTRTEGPSYRDTTELASIEGALETELKTNPGARAAQKALARAMTVTVHGEAAFADAQRASAILFGGGLEGVSETVFRDVVGEVPT